MRARPGCNAAGHLRSLAACDNPDPHARRTVEQQERVACQRAKGAQQEAKGEVHAVAPGPAHRRPELAHLELVPAAQATEGWRLGGRAAGSRWQKGAASSQRPPAAHLLEKWLIIARRLASVPCTICAMLSRQPDKLSAFNRASWQLRRRGGVNGEGVPDEPGVNALRLWRAMCRPHCSADPSPRRPPAGRTCVSSNTTSHSSSTLGVPRMRCRGQGVRPGPRRLSRCEAATAGREGGSHPR